MTTALTKKQEQQIAKYGDLMDTAKIDVSDIIIPKLFLMQQMSKLVQEEKARSGEIRSSLDGKKIAERETGVEIIPFKVYKTWITLNKKGNEFISQEPVTLGNAKKPKEEVIERDGNKIEVLNYEALNYYCLLPDEIKAGVFMPYVVSFRSTGYMAGKTLETHRIRLKEFGQPLCFKTFTLGCEPRENEHGKFFAYTIAEARDTSDVELEAVKHWMAVVQQGVRVDESEFEDKTAASPAPEKDVTPGKVKKGDKF